ncbi:MAG: SGNH/GDSL hydrolase family protein [Thermoguttaceae bacterium]|nr:SGNH/GDSL hydrolase family protein [Thermoguttaceae bacterium]
MRRREFLILSSTALLAPGFSTPVFAAGADLPKNATPRGSYANSKRVFETTGKGRVAFLGGSITEMEGYRPMVCEYLQGKFPKTEFEFVAAGISSTNSDFGAYRLGTDVLGGEANLPVDLFFVEFAVNDDQDGGFDLKHAIRGMEGIVRQIRTARPNVDIVMTFFVNENLMQKYREGSVATSIKAHSLVAERYGISTINLAKEIQEEIDAKEITWQEFGGVHPAPRGNKICADMIAAILDDAWQGETATELRAHPMPEPIDEFCYANGYFRGFEGVGTDGGFSVFVPDWSKIPGGFRDRFGGQPCLCADKPGAETTFEFDGRALGLFVLAGPDAGIVETKIDDGEWTKTNLYHHYSHALHYPRVVTLADDLSAGKHKATIRVSSEKDERSNGNAVRCLQICVNR